MDKAKSKKIYSNFKSTLISFVALVFSFVALIQVCFGWYAISKSATGNGIDIGVEGKGNIIIKAKTDSENIGVDVINSEMEKIKITDSSDNKLFPEICGSFTFFVSKDIENTTNFNFSYKISSKNNEFCKDPKYPSGCYKGATEEDIALSLKYLSSHLLFFKEKDENNRYKNWICANSSVFEKSTANTCEVKIYWVWVGNYSEIFNANNNLIEENTRIKIESYYSESKERLSEIFDGGIKKSENYNNADMTIGLTLRYICFEIEVLG